VSVRAIADEVFGSSRYRGRVERILDRLADAAERPEVIAARAAELAAFEGMDPTEQLRFLFDRNLRALAGRDEPPSARTLLTLVNLDRRLRSLEQLERMSSRLRLRRNPPG
jgi:hypothetical protein